MEKINIPTVGWITFLVLGTLLVVAVVTIVVLLIRFLKGKNVETKILKVTETKREEERLKCEQEHKQTQKELFMSEGKDQLDNQCQVAKNILQELRIRLFDTAEDLFKLEDKKDRDIMELISYRIIDRLNYDVKNDLTRNHIIYKTNYQLEEYTRAKSRGYYSLIKNRLYAANEKLPEFNLPEIMDRIPLNEIEKFFRDVYFSARRIAGQYLESNDINES